MILSPLVFPGRAIAHVNDPLEVKIASPNLKQSRVHGARLLKPPDRVGRPVPAGGVRPGPGGRGGAVFDVLTSVL